MQTMPKIFLSHSGEDKEFYVRPVYNRLKKDEISSDVIFDEVTFQPGNRIMDEIVNFLEITDLFVIFISNKALDSEWVQKELTKIENIKSRNKVHFCPIIIDENIKYDDNRIPLWLQEENIINYVSAPYKAASIIRQRYMELIYSKKPSIYERDSIFVGRNDYVQKIEDRLDDFYTGMPISLIVSGIEGIGRRTLLKHSMEKSNIKKHTYLYTVLNLDAYNSIEDLLVQLYEMGFCKKNEHIGEYLCKVKQMSLDNKENELIGYIQSLQIMNEIIIICDDGCIVDHQGKIASWYLNVIKNNGLNSKLTVLVASKFRTTVSYDFKEFIYHVHVDELTQKERAGLLHRLANIESVDICVDIKERILNILTGYPEQVKYIIYVLKELGERYFKEHINDFVQFNSKKASVLLQGIEEVEGKMDVLSFLCLFDYIGTEYIIEIIEEERREYIYEFCRLGICEYVGMGDEYIRVSDIVRDYVHRRGYTISTKYKEKINDVAKNFIKNMPLDRDLSTYLYNIKEAVVNNIEIDQSLVIPSVYLKAIHENYVKGDYKRVEELSYKMLEGENSLDERVVFEARYLLCSALAKLRKSDFFTEVRNIGTGKYEADKEFLFGFYYRQTGKLNTALDYINRSLEKRKNFTKAKREKVQIYIMMQEYEKALMLAKENYNNNVENPYHIHAYFTCVLKSEKSENKNAILKNLINDMENIKTMMASEMTLRMNAQYEAYVNNNYDLAISYINEAIEKGYKEYYARAAKFDIAAKFGDVKVMEIVLDGLKNTRYYQHHSDHLVYMEAELIALKGDVDSAIAYFSSKVKFYTDDAKGKIISNLGKRINF